MTYAHVSIKLGPVQIVYFRLETSFLNYFEQVGENTSLELNTSWEISANIWLFSTLKECFDECSAAKVTKLIVTIINLLGKAVGVFAFGRFCRWLFNYT